MKLLTVAETRRIEAEADAALLSYAQMMQNAGAAACQRLRDSVPLDAETTILFLIGKGNNGGDGLVMARDLARTCPAQLRLYLVSERDAACDLLADAREAGLFIASAADDRDLRLLRSLVNSADVIVDAVFGIGLRLPLSGSPARVLRAVNRVIAERSGIAPATLNDPSEPSTLRRATPPFVFALDCPSGVDADSGQVDSAAVRADETLSFIAAKRDLVSYPAAGFVGKLVVSDIGIPADFAPLREIKATVIDAATAASLLPSRGSDGHKGSFGKALIVAGCGNYIGAASLAAEAAYRAGCGLASVATTRQVMALVAGRLREPTWLPLPDVDGAIAESAVDLVAGAAGAVDALMIGPGLGRHASTAAFLSQLLQRADLPPLALDADALNILSDCEQWHKIVPSGSIVTPHAGEMARMSGQPIDAVLADRYGAAESAAAAWNLIVVLKGAHTVIAAPDGRVAVSPFKCDALGTAGTGDVLSGLLAGLLASGMSPFDCARLGVYVHALAGVMAADRIGSSRSVVAGDVLASLGMAFGSLESP